MIKTYKVLLIYSLFYMGLTNGLLAKDLFPITQDVLKNIDTAMPTTLKDKPAKMKKILVYANCGGFVHTSISAGKAMLESIQKHFPNFEFTFDDNPENYTPEKISIYDAILNLNATHISKTFAEPQRKALLDFVYGGKAFIGIHAASDAGDWSEYTNMIGGNFNGHPWNAGGTWDFEVEAKGHYTCQCLEPKFSHKDEIYRHKDVPAGLQFLVTLDSNSEANALMENNKNGPYIFETVYGVSWLKNYGKGRVFYTNFGHNPETYWNPKMVEHYNRGFLFVLSN